MKKLKNLISLIITIPSLLIVCSEAEDDRSWKIKFIAVALILLILSINRNELVGRS